MRYFSLLVLFGLFTAINSAQAQSVAQRQAANIATLRAVVNFKIDDEEIIRDIESLRQDQRFNRDLQRMMDRLSNTRNKDSRNRRVMEILEKAGRDITDVLR